MAKITLPNGTILDSNDSQAQTATKYAGYLRLDHVRVFLAIHPSGEEEYLIIENGQPVFASQQYESVGARLGVMAMLQPMEASSALQ